jgi:hypothetical protein
MARQPSQRFGMFVRGVIVEHCVDRLAGRVHTAPDHGAVEHAEGGKQGSGAVPLLMCVIVWKRSGLIGNPG